jgi:hypothetical protein
MIQSAPMCVSSRAVTIIVRAADHRKMTAKPLKTTLATRRVISQDRRELSSSRPRSGRAERTRKPAPELGECYRSGAHHNPADCPRPGSGLRLLRPAARPRPDPRALRRGSATGSRTAESVVEGLKHPSLIASLRHGGGWMRNH